MPASLPVRHGRAQAFPDKSGNPRRPAARRSPRKIVTGSERVARHGLARGGALTRHQQAVRVNCLGLGEPSAGSVVELPAHLPDATAAFRGRGRVGNVPDFARPRRDCLRPDPPAAADSQSWDAKKSRNTGARDAAVQKRRARTYRLLTLLPLLVGSDYLVVC